jgi:hypothetical protein
MNLNQAVDEIRRSQWRQASGEGRKPLKCHRFLVLRNRDNLDSSGEEKLRKLMEANEALATAYVLKEQFRTIFTFRTLDWAQRALKNWCEMAQRKWAGPLQEAGERIHGAKCQSLRIRKARPDIRNDRGLQQPRRPHRPQSLRHPGSGLSGAQTAPSFHHAFVTKNQSAVLATAPSVASHAPLTPPNPSDF